MYIYVYSTGIIETTFVVQQKARAVLLLSIFLNPKEIGIPVRHDRIIVSQELAICDANRWQVRSIKIF